jgi:hypothetical protein
MAMSSNNITLHLYRPEAYQRAVHNGLKDHWGGSIHVVKAVRQCGKSMMCENIIIECSLRHAHQTSIWVSPTIKQSKRIFKSIVKNLRNSGLLLSHNGTDLDITFINGSQILFASAEQGDNIRGATVSKYGIMIIDEAAYITDEVYYVCTPFVNANNAPTLIVSTPRFKSGFFYDFFEDGRNGKPNIYSYDFTEYPNPYLTKERLEMYRSKMPLNLFRADYLGQWMEAMSDIFGGFKRILNNSVTLDGNYTAGIDWGVGKSAKSEDSDQTSLSIFNSLHQQVRIYHWNDLDETTTINRIVAALKENQVRKVVVETNSIGSVYLGLLKKAIQAAGVPCQVIEFVTSNDSKRQVIEALIVEVQNRTIQLLDDAEQSLQMSAYTMERTPSGKITYNAAPGYHDDCIIATALALHGTKRGTYNIM